MIEVKTEERSARRAKRRDISMGVSEFRNAALNLLTVSVCAGALAQGNLPATLEIRAGTAKAKVSPVLYGLMTEEINFSYDGGLYAELVRNRTFQDSPRDAAHWSVDTMGGAEASIKIDKTTGPSTALPVSLQVEVRKASVGERAGVANEGFWGISVQPHTTYRGSFYAKAADASIGPVTVSVVNNDSGKAIETTVPDVGTEWKRYEFTLTSGAGVATSANRLVLSVGAPGTVWFSLVSLFPPTYKDRVNGDRIDLSEKLAAMQPSFLRFPGGNYLEGDHINERFEWKKTIGPLVDRPTHPSPWRYHSSDGMGLLEFLGWCEDLKMQPLLAVYAGYSMRQEFVRPGADLDPYVLDALDEIEYVTGDASTKWGAQRAKDGHPAPFELAYVEIGNEDFFDKSGTYEGRYAQFYKAIKAKHPKIQIIATMAVKQMKADVVDDHFYRRAQEFYDDAHHYDATDRNGPKIFVGEWATREGSPTPNFGAALGDAAWMTGMERNSDVVIMAAYAPLLVNVNPGGMQWETDLIGYDAMQSYGSPSYYAQVMFRRYLGDHILDGTLSGAGPRFFYSATRSADSGVIHLKLVNASSTAQKIMIALRGVTGTGRNAKLISLSAKTTAATNTLGEPTKIVPVESALKLVGPEFSHTVPGYAIQILEIPAK